MSYKISEKMKEDKEQWILNPDMSITVNPSKYAKKSDIADYDKIVLCPFCLNETKLFRFKRKHGFCECPNCLNLMTVKTLIVSMTTEEFAKWVFDYRLSGFWKKIYPDFETWKKRLKELGISYEFWENYKRLRGDNIKEDESEWH